MASNEFYPRALAGRAMLAAGLLGALLAGCSVSAPRQSPIIGATKDSPTVLDIYRGQGMGGQTDPNQPAPRDTLRQKSSRPVAPGDGETQRYWSAIEPMRQRFARLPNPDLVMVVFPHLSKGQYPVPAYVTTFPMYLEAPYALPGEVREDLRSSPPAPASSLDQAGKGR